jgi:hypothetical protein
MSKFIGRVVDMGIGRETSRGVGVEPAFWIPKMSFNFDDKVVKVRSEAGVGTLADSEEALVTTKYGQGDLEGEIRDKSFGLLLYAMLGTLSTSAPADSAYTHSFSLLESAQHPSLSMFVQDPISNEQYELCMLNQLEISAELDAVAKYTAQFIGKQGIAVSARTVTYLAENKFTKKHISVKFATDLASLTAASPISIKRLSFVVNKNVAMDDVLGTAEPEDILNKQISVEGEIELNYEDETIKNYMKDNSNKAMEIKLTNTDAVIGSATRPSLTIRMPKVDFFDWQPDYANNEIVRQTISFKANQDVSGGNAIISTCALVNAQTAY